MRPVDSSDPPPLIIGGCHRSGTTLLRRLLNGHSRIFCPSEIKFYRDLLGEYFADPLAHLRLGRTIETFGLPRDVWLDEMGEGFVRCYRRAMQAHGKSRWADKNPENVFHVEHWDRLLQGRLRFIFVLRHPYDVAASMIETPMPKTIVASDSGRARHIRSYIDAGLAFLAANNDRSMVVRYEDLTANPGEALTRLLGRIGESFEPTMLAGPAVSHESDVLQDPKVRAPISTANVGRWRKDLSLSQIDALRRELADLMPALGYSEDQTPIADNRPPG